MIYEFKSRIRYSEVGKDKNIPLSGILDYFQDCSTFHSEVVGLGIGNLEQGHHGWILSSWQVIVKEYPTLGEEVVISTWPYEFKGFYGSRNFTMKNEKGEILAYANSLWIFIDVNTGRPVKVTQEELKGYELEEKLEMEYAPRKITIPETYKELESFPIMKHQIDTNQHVNNGEYIRMAQDVLPDSFKIVQMRAEYKKAAVFGDRVYPRIHEKKDGYKVMLCDETGKVYAIVEFTGREEI